jgi:transcriptional regulator with XRE-family HTH domain
MVKLNKQTLTPNNDQMNTIGKNIRLLRQKNGWSQGEVAKRLQISIPAFSKIETGITDINISRLDQIARLFEVSILEIMVKEGEISALGNLTEITALKDKLNDREDEIIKLQKRVIELYEELRKR